MGIWADTMGTPTTTKTAPKTKTSADTDAPLTLRTEDSPKTSGTELSETTRTVLSELFGASAAAREFVCELADNYKKDGMVDNEFRRVFVKKDDPEGDYLLDEDKALDKWGVDGYDSVFRLVTGKKLGRKATTDEVARLIRLEAERKRKARKAAKEEK